MTTLGTHPFIPSASKLGAPIPCQHCPNEASHPVHDWLTPTAPWRRMNTKALGQLLAMPGLSDEAQDLIMDELDERKYDETPEDTPSLDTSFHDHEMAIDDELSAITPEEMVQLENLPNGEPFEDVGGYCQRAGR